MLSHLPNLRILIVFEEGIDLQRRHQPRKVQLETFQHLGASLQGINELIIVVFEDNRGKGGREMRPLRLFRSSMWSSGKYDADCLALDLGNARLMNLFGFALDKRLK